MKRLLETTDRALVESIRLAFEAEGIPLEIRENAAGNLPFVPVVLNLVRDEDEPRAREVLASLQ